MQQLDDTVCLYVRPANSGAIVVNMDCDASEKPGSHTLFDPSR